ncbi:MAG: type II toxin-antitoxin system HipA family toxin [Verrucomicrobia bacterium]|nr:type II toxin-antitoxin system HipA family toxin [Verrucomicrobiota bacterium]
MGRLGKSRALAVWMNGERVGEWRLPASGAQEFRYDEEWLSSPASRPISLSFPLRPSRESYRVGVEAFFDNLLPDNRQIRERIQRRFRTASVAAFDLLREIGRDCVGALQILPVDEGTPDVRRITGEPLTEARVAKLLTASLGSSSGFGEAEEEDAFRISLAGAQEKTALLRHKGRWYRPTGTTPTTHIFKLPIGLLPQGFDLSTSVENEWLCAQVVREYGIPVANCSLETFGEHKTLVVDRFDRRLSVDSRWWIRLPQEDFCQATATAGALKYEAHGGPGIRRILEVLLGSEDPAEDRRDFLRTLVVFWLLAAIDGHAKNFSLFLLSGGAYRLTPRYDVLSAYPLLGNGAGKIAPQKLKMAMAVEGKNRHYLWESIHAQHWIETARRSGVADMPALLAEIVDRTPMVIAKVQNALPKGFPVAVADAVMAGLRAAGERLGADLTQESR